MRLERILAASSLMLLIHTIPANAEYEFQLVVPPGGEFTQVFGINDDGIVTGNAFDGFSGFSFTYNMETGEYTIISDLEDFSAFDINNKGVIVGEADPLCAIRDKMGNVTAFEPPIEAAFCEARGVNAKGDVTGWAGDIGYTIGFVYDKNKNSFEIFVPSVLTISNAINSAGQSVGSAVGFDPDDLFPGSQLGRYGFLRDKDGSVNFFNVTQSLPGSGTAARGISENGLVTGWFRFDPASPAVKSFVINAPTGAGYQEITLTDDQMLYQSPCDPNIPPPPGEGYVLETIVYASQIRNDGVVVGSCIDAYVNLGIGNFVDYYYGFVATPVE